tara:strand:+ start:1282 stop:1638 length:357 start_codon:yes stop_codon:yes gene_type:complete
MHADACVPGSAVILPYPSTQSAIHHLLQHPCHQCPGNCIACHDRGFGLRTARLRFRLELPGTYAPTSLLMRMFPIEQGLTPIPGDVIEKGAHCKAVRAGDEHIFFSQRVDRRGDTIMP